MIDSNTRSATSNPPTGSSCTGPRANRGGRFNTSCGTGKGVVKGFNKCRHQNGGRDGKCNSKVKGFKCSEGKRDGVPHVQYSSHVSCKKGGKKVAFSYTQND